MTQNIETVRYSVLVDHTFYYQNYLKEWKFCRYVYSHLPDFYIPMTKL